MEREREERKIGKDRLREREGNDGTGEREIQRESGRNKKIPAHST